MEKKSKRNYTKRNGQVMSTFTVRMNEVEKEAYREKCESMGRTMSDVAVEMIRLFMSGRVNILEGFNLMRTEDSEDGSYQFYHWTDPTCDNEFYVTLLNGEIVDSLVK